MREHPRDDATNGAAPPQAGHRPCPAWRSSLPRPLAGRVAGSVGQRRRAGINFSARAGRLIRWNGGHPCRASAAISTASTSSDRPRAPSAPLSVILGLVPRIQCATIPQSLMFAQTVDPWGRRECALRWILGTSPRMTPLLERRETFRKANGVRPRGLTQPGAPSTPHQRRRPCSSAEEPFSGRACCK